MVCFPDADAPSALTGSAFER